MCSRNSTTGLSSGEERRRFAVGRIADARGLYAGCYELLPDELCALLGETLVVAGIAAFVGKAIKLHLDVRHRRQRCSQLGQANTGGISQHMLIGAEKQVHGDAGVFAGVAWRRTRVVRVHAEVETGTFDDLWVANC